MRARRSLAPARKSAQRCFAAAVGPSPGELPCEAGWPGEACLEGVPAQSGSQLSGLAAPEQQQEPGQNAGETDLAQDPHELPARGCHCLRPSMTSSLRPQLPAPLFLCRSPSPALFLPVALLCHHLTVSVLQSLGFLPFSFHPNVSPTQACIVCQ